MFEPKPYFDYCISEKCIENNKYETTIKLLYDYGYRTVAINQIVDGNDLESKKKKRRGEPREATDPVPEPHKLVTVEGCEDLKLLNRLTIVFSNQEVIHKIVKSPNYKKYHIVAVLPTTHSATLFVCNNFDADILTFDPENKNFIKRSRKMFNQLVEKGYHFEILYSPAIEDSTLRKTIIHTAHVYHTFLKSKNIIVSSGATDPILIRTPYDVINLGFIFGLNEQQSRNAVAHCGRQVFINSVGRRHGKAVIFVENIEDIEEKTPQINVETINIDDDDDNGDTVHVIDSDEDMETDQPAAKKIKQ